VNRTLKRIGPLRFGVIIGVMYALFSLIFVPFFALAFLVGLFAPHQNVPPGFPQVGNVLGFGLGLFFCVLAPVMYGIMGFLMGALMAWIYNVVAKWTGGIEFEVE
jgi:hypothetical protein